MRVGHWAAPMLAANWVGVALDGGRRGGGQFADEIADGGAAGDFLGRGLVGRPEG